MNESPKEPIVLMLDFNNNYYALKKNNEDKWDYANLPKMEYHALEILDDTKKNLSTKVKSASKLDAIIEGYNILNSKASEYAKNSNAEYVVINPYVNAFTRHVLKTTPLPNDLWDVEVDVFLVKKK
jgi:hypothetical protein